MGRRKIIAALLIASLSGCSVDVRGSSNSNPAHTLIASNQINRIPEPLQCFVRDPQGAGVLPTFGAFAFVRDGKISANAFEHPEIARTIMASNNNILKKARYLEYVRAITNNDQEAIALGSGPIDLAGQA